MYHLTCTIFQNAAAPVESLAMLLPSRLSLVHGNEARGRSAARGLYVTPAAPVALGHTEQKGGPAGPMMSDGYSTVRRLSCNSGL